MANSLGGLLVTLGLDAAEYVSGLTKAEYQTKKTLDSISNGASIVTKALASLGIGLSAGLIASWAKGVIDATAALDDMAERTGSTVEKLGDLVNIADVGGHSLETLESGLIKLAKALGGTDEKAKAAAAALTSIGLNRLTLQQLDPADALKVIAERLNTYRDGLGKTSFALAVWGKQGAANLPILKDLAEQTETLKKRTAEEAAESEILQKAWKRLELQSGELKKSFVIDMVPALNEIVGAMTVAYKESGTLMAAWVALGGVAANVLGITDRQKTAARVQEIDDQIALARKQLDAGSLKPPGSTNKLFSFLIPDIKLGDEAIGQLKVTIDKLEAEKKRLTAVVEKPPAKPVVPFAFDEEAAKRAAAEAKRLAAELKRLEQERTRDAEKTAKLQSEGMEEFEKDASDAFKFVADMQKKLKDREGFENIYGEDRLIGMSLEDIRIFHREVLNGADAIMIAGDAAALAYAGFDENGKSVIDTAKEGVDVAKSLGLTFTSAFEDAITGGKKFRDILNAIGQDIARLIIRKSITEPLLKASEDALKDSGGIGGLFNKLLSGFGGGAATPVYDTGFASGTDYVPRTGFALIHKGEQIIPAGQGGGGAVNIYISNDNRGADIGAVGRLEMAHAQLRRDIVPIVRNATRRTV